MMSARGSRPKMASDTVTEPAFLPSKVVTWSSMSLALLWFLGSCGLAFALCSGRLCFTFGRCRLGLGLCGGLGFSLCGGLGVGLGGDRLRSLGLRGLRRGLHGVQRSHRLGGGFGGWWLLARFGRRRGIRQLELTRLRHATRQLLLHRIAHHDPAAFDARHGALDQDQPTLDVSLPDAKIECGHAFDAKMSGHLLVLEGLPWILAAASRTM